MWLRNAKIPKCLLVATTPLGIDGEGFALVDLEVVLGKIQQIQPSSFGREPAGEAKDRDLQGKIVLPCFVDMHTHLDKSHSWERSPNPDNSFNGAIGAIVADYSHWTREDLWQRMEFALQCSYAHGTQALRTHLDCPPSQMDTTLAVFQELSRYWADRLLLQGVSLVGLEYFWGSYGEKIADNFAEIGGVLGGLAYTNPDLDSQLDRVFALAKDRHLSLDFHVDENGDPESQCLQAVARAAIRHQFTDPIVCGHCCSLAVQPESEAQRTIALVKEAGIAIVSLPLCNLFLQDRQKNKTPYWRGITLVKELKAAGIPVAIAHDNCRDAFYGFGDHDLLQIFAISVLIGHLDLDASSDWISSVTTTPAQLMQLPIGMIEVGKPANLILFNARHYSELLSRPQQDRVVLRHGQEITASLPEYPSVGIYKNGLI